MDYAANESHLDPPEELSSILKSLEAFFSFSGLITEPGFDEFLLDILAAEGQYLKFVEAAFGWVYNKGHDDGMEEAYTHQEILDYSEERRKDSQ